MSCSIMIEKIQILLEESSATFSLMCDAGGHPNMDFADYASHTGLNAFRNTLQNPDLSGVQLASLLRRAYRNNKVKNRTRTNWTAFMADYVTQNANANMK